MDKTKLKKELIIPVMPYSRGRLQFHILLETIVKPYLNSCVTRSRIIGSSIFLREIYEHCDAKQSQHPRHPNYGSTKSYSVHSFIRNKKNEEYYYQFLESLNMTNEELYGVEDVKDNNTSLSA